MRKFSYNLKSREIKISPELKLAINNDRKRKENEMPSSFVEKFLEFTQDLESPTSFFVWSAISTISAVMRDNCYIIQGPSKFYPNVYTLLLSPSSSVKKGNPLKLSARLVRSVNNTKVISGRASMQAVIKLLDNIETTEKGEKLLGASAFLHSEELTSFIATDMQAVDILTDWYDYHEKWDNYIISSGVSHLKNVCITLFAASNEELVKDIFTKKAIYGGLLARTFIIYEERRRHKNSLRFYEQRIELAEDIFKHLLAISKLKGEMTFTPDANSEYHMWYNSIEDDLDQTGVVARMAAAGVLKIAMILAMSRKPELVIIKEDIIESIRLCTGLLKNYEKFVAGVGTSPIAEPGKVLLMLLLRSKNYEIKLQEILDGSWGSLDIETLNKVTETFQGAGIIHVLSNHNGIYYKLTEKAIAKYEAKTRSS